MEITYIGHSGFLIEWDTCYWLFDYYKGEIPALNSKKKIIVFASHKHADHYNPEIFNLSLHCKNIEYILSSDIKPRKYKLQGQNIQGEIDNKILSVKPSGEYEIFDGDNNKILIKTLKSTDCGVAFLLSYQGKTIYHAGDLNLWVWKGETKQYNNNMTAMFLKEMEVLKDIHIDIAFAPLDPRQDEDYCLGIERLLSAARVRYLFPMHFWDKPEIIQRFQREKGVCLKETQLMEVNQPGQKWRIEL